MPLLKEPAADASKLLQLLHERLLNSENWLRDTIAEIACMRLANLRDPDILFQAIDLKSSFWGQSTLASGLCTPRGREALLQRLGDARIPLDWRLVYARLLQNAGVAYHQAVTGITENGTTNTGQPQGNNAEYLTRIARLILDNRQQEDFCLILLDSLDSLFSFIMNTTEEPLIADRNTALQVLQALYEAKPSERIKFQVEMALSHGGREAYDRLNSPCGPVIAILTVPEAGKYHRPTERSFAFEYECHVLDEPVDAPSIVFLNTEIGNSWVIPSQIPFDGRGASGGRSIELPKDLPHGHYRIYLQFTREGKVISTGHYDETEL